MELWAGLESGLQYPLYPLHPTASRKPIKGTPGAGPTRIAPQWLDITPEYLYASG